MSKIKDGGIRRNELIKVTLLIVFLNAICLGIAVGVSKMLVS